MFRCTMHHTIAGEEQPPKVFEADAWPAIAAEATAWCKQMATDFDFSLIRTEAVRVDDRRMLL